MQPLETAAVEVNRFPGLDAMPVKDYLNGAMFARLLALFAILSSLVALGTPAHAMMAESSVSRSAAEICDAEKEDSRCECFTSVRLKDWRIVLERKCRLRVPGISVPTVYVGSDRAYE